MQTTKRGYFLSIEREIRLGCGVERRLRASSKPDPIATINRPNAKNKYLCEFRSGSGTRTVACGVVGADDPGGW